MTDVINRILIVFVISCRYSYSLPVLLGRIGLEDVEATDFLQKFGYLPRGNNQLSAKSFTSALKQMQRMAGLEETGEFDERTKRMMNQPRCGLPDIETKNLDSNKLGRKKRAAYQFKWKEKTITYGCKKPTRNARIHYDDLRRVMRQAAAQWSQLADVEIVETADEKPMIQISAGNAMHYPCTIPLESMTLAHAFFPPNGQIHVNDNVRFAMTNFTENYNQNSLYSVVAHEMGHALGFEHSSDRNSVMFAYDIPRKWEFTPTDKYHMQVYYGTKKGSPVVKKDKPKKKNDPILGDEVVIKKEEQDEIQPNECRVEKPVVVLYRDEFFVFKSSWVWRISSDWKRLIMKPTLIDTFFRGLPSPIDAAVTIEGNLWVFIRNKVYTISGNRILHAPLSLHDLGIQESSVDLAYEWHYFNPPAVYIWKNEKYWRLDEKMYYRRVDERYPKDISLNWANVPKNSHSAFTSEKEIHFIRNDMVYRMNSSRSDFDIADGYPKSLQSFFQFCPQAESLISSGSPILSKLISISLIPILNALTLR